MQELTHTEKVFSVLDTGAELLEKEEDVTYLEALAEIGEMIFQGSITKSLNPELEKKVVPLIDDINTMSNISKEEYRRAIQLAVLKGMKEATQPHHAMTPDAVSLFIGYLVKKILGYEQLKDKPAVIFDPAVGSGNLLTAVMNQIGAKSNGIGGEADETLLRLSYVNSNLQEHSVDLFHQDSVSAPFVDNMDVIISDLPVGFYPNDDMAVNFKLAADEGHSYVHHLLIEKSLKHIKPGGFLFFIVPNFLFETEEAKKLHEFIKSEGIIYSLMQLPKTMFKNEKWGKSILVLRKKKEGIKSPKQALLVELPSFSNEGALGDMVQRISSWFDEQLKGS
ncbi:MULTISPECIES: class I SAM-dependent methyltransferase [Bacillaceae]|uniref:Class I SAM-dependent methyltransferase n=1 Tax=Evansella alkalicola TaxID=745819 RepID=A0ABS6JV50_9BACI|nr:MULTISPECIES: class I SAM-dependent methyltransferase [Bacillaceae]MBU9721122.1 class I SAM-dependent methyltransferase [Bacillus alkalicola]